VVATDTPERLLSQLTGSAGYDIEVEGDTTELLATLESIPDISSFAIAPIAETRRSNIQIVARYNSEPGREIASLIVSKGLGLYEMRRTRATLEDVFLNLITEESAIASSPSETIQELLNSDRE
jgi:ABC-2 type transport system ATP-binding protein